MFLKLTSGDKAPGPVIIINSDHIVAIRELTSSISLTKYSEIQTTRGNYHVTESMESINNFLGAEMVGEEQYLGKEYRINPL